MNKLVFVNLALILIFLSCQTIEPKEEGAKPYSWETGVTETQVFTANIISSALPEFASSFSPDGQSFYFNRTTADRSSMKIYESHYQNDFWTEPKALAFSDGIFMDIDPFISADGTRLYFSSNRPMEGSESKDFDLWYVEKSGKEWSTPFNLGSTVNTADDEIFSTLSASNNLYFNVFKNDFETVEIYRSIWKNDAFQAPEKIEFPAHDSIRLTNPCISPNEQFMILSSVNYSGMGGSDLYISRPLKERSWSLPENLGSKVNSAFSDFAPCITPDGSYLYYTSERPGIVPDTVSGRPPGDIYGIKL